MHWTVAELMAVPTSYYRTLIAMVNEEAKKIQTE